MNMEKTNSNFPPDGQSALWKYKAIFIVQLLCCSTCLFATEAVSVNGYLNVLTQDGNHRAISPLSSSNQFQLLICRDGRWAIKVRSLTETNYISYLTFDGADTYCVNYSDLVIGITNGRPGIIATEPFANHLNNACVSAGGYPFLHFDGQARAQALWLAFGAGSYLHDHPQKTMPLPWTFARLNLLAYGFQIEYELSTNAPYIIQNLKFVRSTALDLSDEKELDRPELNRGDESFHGMLEEQLEKRKKLWPNGFIAAVFQVSGYTNYHDMEIPLKFSLNVFNPQLKNEDKLSRKYEGTVDNLTETNLSNLPLPPIQSKLLVRDERRRYNNSTKIKTDVHYGLKPGDEWLSRDASLVTNLFYAGLQSHASDKERYFSKRTKRTIIKAALLISLIVPIFIFFCFKTKFSHAKS